MEDVGKRIRTYREQADITQAELARRAKLSKAYLSELENDAGRKPSADVLLRIADALDVTIADLLGRSAGHEGPVEIPEGLREFADDRKLPEDEVRRLARIRLRGGAPKTKERWAFIYDAIKGSDHLDKR